MQITLNQAEIEQAIKNYVNDQVNIREGHDITIDLKAGRGPEGFTATIDIVAPGAIKDAEPTAASKPVTTPKPRAERAVTQDQPMPDAPETAQEAASEAPPETATSPQAEPETAATEQEADSTDEKTPPAEKPKSLFANLGKPKN